MKCQRCQSDNTISVSAKCSDMFNATYEKTGRFEGGYVSVSAIGAGDFVEFTFCADCGQIQGTFPCAPDAEEEEEPYDEGV